MVILHVILLLGTIMLAARWGGMGVGFAGGIGLAIAVFILGVPAGSPPVDVMLIILSTILALSVMQLAGGMDYLVILTEKLLRHHPGYLNILAPAVTFILTVLSGTGYTAMSVMNVIQEVAKDNGIRPSQPLSSAVVASQLGITASPISAATAIMYGTVEVMGVSFGDAMLVVFPTALFAMLIAAFIASRQGIKLADDPVCQKIMQENKIVINKHTERVVAPGAKSSVILFLLGVLFVVCMLLFKPIIGHAINSRDLIIITMFVVSTIIIFACKVDMKEVKNSPLFKSGAESLVVVLGIVWLSSTLIGAHIEEIKTGASDVLRTWPMLLAAVFFCTSAMLFSQGATSALLMPIAASIGIGPDAILASFVAVSALYITNIYPTTAFAIATDDTGSFLSRRWNGSRIVNHPFFLPGCLSIICSVPFGFLLARIIL
ncbi:C4-dicarboxylate ABC transporter [Citrobacter amalonaticus]|uniref:C4-dicarboxylate transporter n=1 Tax=Citrobacter amalonaticus TaxID=35703 RepID=A0A2S4S0T1_CITAM|nr:anaerobic C4-dicarboxylate transporter [Citrobacter amalonaticus]POT58509.1 C4-dicarboxylate ABC transporter [Citrobacter amalonaticus]POT75966.1 C4-dicarboxylate ABC transporter [Citrobacter amalonaticus]POU67036.1 C4-dicarboxylate ABC transporter [Citrobacter amalonaticus]POV05201.1 C4-dicarboxylate ABC transporter [Citrobacter amalonaticus]